jgi:hypothetical protein
MEFHPISWVQYGWTAWHFNDLAANYLAANDLPANDLAANDLPANDLPANDLLANDLPTNGLTTRSNATIVEFLLLATLVDQLLRTYVTRLSLCTNIQSHSHPCIPLSLQNLPRPL